MELNATAKSVPSLEDYLAQIDIVNATMMNGTVFVNNTYNNTFVVVQRPFPSGYSTPQIVVASVLVTFLMIIVVVGNMLVIIAIATEKALKSIQNWFIASLAVADFFLGLVIMPFSLANELMGYWIFGPWWCDIHSAMDVLLSTASIMNLCLISLDRFWSITQAVEYLKKRTPARAAFMIGFVWIMSALICIPPLLGWKVKRPPEEFPKCELSQDIGYVLYSALGSFYVPSCIMVFVYIRIYFAAKARARRGIRKAPRRTPPTDQVTSFSHVAGDSDKSTKPMPCQPCLAPVDNNSNKNERDRQIATIEPPPPPPPVAVTIPIISCDYASDISTSDAGDIELHEQHAKDTLKVFGPTPQIVKNPLAQCQFRGSAVSVTDASGTRTRAQSMAIDADMVSEFDPSSSDSGVISRCAVVKPLKLRLCQPIFGKKGHKARRSENVVVQKDPDSQVDQVTARSPTIPVKRDPEKERRRIARKKEKRATLILGLIMGSFIACWLPFFLLYIITPICGSWCDVPDTVFAIAFWLGYMNSALNPVIYTIFNKDFRRAFRRILFK